MYKDWRIIVITIDMPKDRLVGPLQWGTIHVKEKSEAPGLTYMIHSRGGNDFGPKFKGLKFLSLPHTITVTSDGQPKNR